MATLRGAFFQGWHVSVTFHSIQHSDISQRYTETSKKCTWSTDFHRINLHPVSIWLQAIQGNTWRLGPRGWRCEGTAAISATSHPLRAGKNVVEKLESLSHHEFGPFGHEMMECLDLGPPLMFIVKLYNFFLAFCSFKLQHGWEGTCDMC